jgi:hypothetical protein
MKAGLEMRGRIWPRWAVVVLLLSGCAGTPSTPPPRPSKQEAVLQHYKTAFYDAVGDEVDAEVRLADVLDEVSRCRLLLLGDYHTDAAYHRRALAFLDRLADRVGPLLLVIEFLRWEDRDDLERYFSDEITLDGLRKRAVARNRRSWLRKPNGLDPDGFLSFLERAKARGWLVIPAENVKQAPLEERDGIIARRALEFIEEHRGHFPVIFYGQAHLLGPDRLERLLPLRLVTILPRPPKPLNDDAVIREGGILRIRPGVFYLGPKSEAELEPVPVMAGQGRW